MTKYPPRLLLSIRSLLLLCFLAVWLLAAADVPVPPAHGPADCQSRCGDIDIPYPFGIGDQCAINPGFSLDCTRDVNGADRPFSGPFEVTKISVPDAKAWMKMNISWGVCYDRTTGQMEEQTWGGNFTYSPFRFSKDNKIFVVGCNSLAYITSEYYSIGCLSECYNEARNTSSCSPGSGCCEAEVPADMGYCWPYFNHNYTGCGYAVVMEAKEFRYLTTYRNSNAAFWNAYNGTVPIVMDWTIAWSTCDDAKKNLTSYACVSDNSDCVDSTNGPDGGNAYRCKCLDGFQGNPYVNGGCTDIDECLQNNTTNACKSIGATCLNTHGNYTCLCPPGTNMMDNMCMANRKSSSWVIPVVDHGVNEGEPVSEQCCEQVNEDPFRDPEPEGQDLPEAYEDEEDPDFVPDDAE